MRMLTKIPFLSVAIGLLAVSAWAYSTGPLDNKCGNPPTNTFCTECHATFPLNSGLGSVNISGLPASYISGHVYPLTITVSHPTALRWGFELTAQDPSNGAAGEFAITDATATQLSNNPGDSADFVKHTLAGTFPGTSASHTWSFNWTAPNDNLGATFHYAGNAANNNNGSNGDYIYGGSAARSAAYPVYTVLNPIGSTVIPPGGGTLNYNIAGTNGSASPQTIDIWVDVTLPNGATYGPVLGPLQNFVLPANFSLNRDRALSIPASAPAGNYLLNAYFGDYTPPNNTLFTEDHLPFSKSTSGDLGPWQGAVEIVDSGEPFESPVQVSAAPQSFGLLENHPNPFNPATTINFQLPASGAMTLDVFSAAGQKVAQLVNGWREAGSHEVTFDASGLPSGIYLYRLQTGNLQAIGKMMLLK